MNKQCAVLDESYKFEWNVDSQFFESFQQPKQAVKVSNETTDERQQKKRKLTRAEKKEQEKNEELRLRKAEEELLISASNPKTADHFERLLLGRPNDSELWIKYMTFHLHAGEFDRAKMVGYKALQSINIREEDHKLNIWLSLLNMENIYGTEESLNDCLREAVKVNDDYKIYTRMLLIFATSKKIDNLENIVSKVSKKFGKLQTWWLKCAKAFFEVELPDKARDMMQKALSNLPKNEHIPFMSQFALMENRFGNFQKAQTLFEQIITSHPSRIDIWICYVDMLIKSKNITIARHVLERGCALSLKPKKMKSLYAKRKSFEEKYGDSKSLETVKSDIKKFMDSVKNKGT